MRLSIRLCSESWPSEKAEHDGKCFTSHFQPEDCMESQGQRQPFQSSGLPHSGQVT
ncbi:mCG1026698 [Mus musculus]|nr:mCG1026698 [Mus musculus]